MEFLALETADGSLTYQHPKHGASYRSLRGAETESRWVFLQGSRIAQRPSPWNVLELGFGSGLNFRLTAQAAALAQVSLNYVSMEPEPMPSSLWLVEDHWKNPEWGRPSSSGGLCLTVHHCRWQDWSPQDGIFDAVYFDPFGPAVAPDCWSLECFRWAHLALKADGVLATYGASSAARQAMRGAGLQVGILPGAPGKREMTVASPSLDGLAQAKLWKPLQ